MKKTISQKFKLYKTLSLLTVIIGIILMTYMIKVEDEPGALPLFLILTGIVWFIINQAIIKKRI